MQEVFRCISCLCIKLENMSNEIFSNVDPRIQVVISIYSMLVFQIQERQVYFESLFVINLK